MTLKLVKLQRATSPFYLKVLLLPFLFLLVCSSTLFESLNHTGENTPFTFWPIPPLHSTGSCSKGTHYTINKISDLFYHLDDLECVFTAGKTPTAIGLGHYHGTLLTAVANYSKFPKNYSQIAILIIALA